MGGRCVLVISILVAIVAYFIYQVDLSKYPRFYTNDFIEQFGYRWEKHRVETEDGVVLTLFRLLPPHQRSTSAEPPILIQGGLFCTSDNLVIAGPKRDLAYILVDEGYDVWLGNFRGTRYSSLANSSSLDFGTHEIGVLDYSATIDYVLEKTNKPKVSCIGISLGCSSFLALLSTRTEYNQKISQVLHLGPGIALQIKTLTQQVFHFMYYFPGLVDMIGITGDWPYRGWSSHLTCTWAPWFCHFVIHDSSGHPDPGNTNMSIIISSTFPSGNNLGSLQHIYQHSSKDSEFKMRDYGETENQLRYNSTKPPFYDLSAITVPTKLFTTTTDILVDNEVSRRVFAKIPGMAGEYIIGFPFTHSNFGINGNINPIFIQQVLKTLKSSKNLHR